MIVGFNNFNNTYLQQRTKYVSPSFKSKTDIPKVIEFLRNQPNLKCAYCGERMITKTESQEFVKKTCELTDRDLSDHLKEYKYLMKKNERDVTDYICRAVEELPSNNLSLKDVLIKMLPYHKSKILDYQINILNNINDLSKNISIEAHDGKIIRNFVAEKLKDLTENKELKNNEENIEINNLDQKHYLSDLYKIRFNFHDPNNYSKVKEELSKIPSSKTNVDAFIVEYAGKTTSEIATKLLSPSLVTIEHLIPQENKEKDSEIYREKNMLLACSQCNSIRGNSSLNAMPQIKVFFWHYIRSVRAAVAKHSNRKSIKNYLESVKNHLENLLNGGLNLYINIK